MKRPYRGGGQNTALIGKTPTPAQKIAHVSNKLGIAGISQQQGSPMNIFDTVIINGAATDRQTVVFFKNASGKSRNFSNWQGLELKAGETLAVNTMSILLLQLSATALNLDTTAITNYLPVGRNLASSQLAFSQAQFKIANSTVFKDFQLLNSLPFFNDKTTGIANADSAVATQGFMGRSLIQLPVSTVIPPNQPIEFTLEIPPITTGAGNFAVMLSLGDQGSIFSAKGTF